MTPAERYARAKEARRAARDAVDAALEVRRAADAAWLDSMQVERDAMAELLAAHEALRESGGLP